jgi:Ca2+-binding RTX toxin-like protein
MATFTVTTVADVVDAGDGELSLREAVQQANATAAEDTILFANALEGRVLTLTQGQLTLSGDTVIDGDANDDGFAVTLSGGSASRVLEVAEIVDVELRDLTVADGRVADASGAGITVGSSASLTMENCSVSGCFAGEPFASFGTGGGIYLESGARLDMSRSTVNGNFAYGHGGGISGAERSYVTLRDCDIVGNSALYGGGIDAGGFLEVARSTFRSNGIYTYNNDAGRGGGLLVTGSATVSQSLFTGNYAPNGGAIHSYDGIVTVTDTTVANNLAFGDEFPGQTAGISGDNITLRRSTVTGNYTTNDGVYYRGAAGVQSSSLRIFDSIVTGNHNRNGPSDVGGTLAFSNGRNIFGEVVTGSVPGDLENVDPALVFAAIDPRFGGGLLALNGGPTLTVALRDAHGNPALGGGEPAETGAVDQRGVARPQPGAINPDIGAFELDQSFVSTTASARNDVLTGTAAADTIAGLAGADLIRGLGSDDTLVGNGGSDTLRGGAGGDLLRGGLGSDWLDGGAGTDRVSYANDAFPQGVAVDLRLEQATRGGELDRLLGIEDVEGSDNPDELVGDGGANRLRGAGGVDRLFGDDGDDALEGGAGDDFLTGDFGNDRLAGNVGDDDLAGGFGVDRLAGGSGRDRLTGGEDADRFAYDRTSDSTPGAANRDLVTDFAHLTDEIDLSAIDARAGTPGVNDAFTFLAERGAAFTGAGQVRWFHSGGDTFVEASTDADRAAELQIELTGLKILTATDFVL